MSILAVGSLLLLPGISDRLAAQAAGGTIRGTVYQGRLSPVPGVEIRLISMETGDTRSTVSGPTGEFVLSVLPPGSYRLEAELAGFRQLIQSDIELSLGQGVHLEVRLEPGELTEQVVVTDVPRLVRTDSASVGVVIDNSSILGLPLDGRNFLELSLLIPGAAPAAQGSPGSVRGAFSVNVSGAREDANNFLLDGVYNGDPKLNTFALNPAVDGIREFEIATSSYDASFGRSGGAQINVATKSGTNAFHGAAYEFFRNASLDARNFFVRAEDGASRYQRNQYGFSLGGPLRKEQAFFFTDYEGTRLREGITRITNVPTGAERSGDFSQSLRPAPINPFTQQPFENARIPSQFLNPIGKAMAALYPLPNRSVAGQNYVSSPVLRDREDRFDMRVDLHPGRDSSLIFRYSFSDRDLFDPYSGPSYSLVPGYGTNIPRRAQNLMAGNIHVFGPHLINEARFAFNRVAAGSFHQNQGTSLNRQIGLPELSAHPRDFGLSFITATGFSPLGDEYNNPQHSVTNVFQVIDNMTYVRGSHLVRFGFDFRNLQQNAYRDVQSRGFLNFLDSGRLTGNALADMLLGYPSLTGGARLDNPQYLRTHSWNYFVQDNWRLRRNLTLQLGVRYEYNSPPVDRFDRANTYDPSAQSLVAVGSGRVPRGVYSPDRNNWAPRIGIAWSPGSSAATVVHAGYGIYYDQSSLAPGEGLYFNTPYFDFQLFFPLPGLLLTLNDPFPGNFPYPLPGSALGFQRDLRTAYFQQWNLKVQQELGKNRLLEVAYVGSKGSKIKAARDLNQADASPIFPNLRPNVQFADITFEESRGNSSYHSLQVRFQQTLRPALSVLGSYTLSKSLDDTSTFFASAGDANFPQNSLDLRAEKGRSNFDVRDRLSATLSEELPLGRGKRYLADHGWITGLLSGWKSHQILTLQSGRPFTVALPPEIDNSNTGRSTLGFGANDRPDRLSSARLADPGPEAWFDANAFRYPAFGRFGDSGRNILDGPGYKDLSVSILKDTFVNENLRLQFRAEFFNLFNNTNFDLPDIFLGSPNFGKILSAQSPRRIQFGLKLIF